MEREHWSRLLVNPSLGAAYGPKPGLWSRKICGMGGRRKGPGPKKKIRRGKRTCLQLNSARSGPSLHVLGGKSFRRGEARLGGEKKEIEKDEKEKGRIVNSAFSAQLESSYEVKSKTLSHQRAKG